MVMKTSNTKRLKAINLSSGPFRSLTINVVDLVTFYDIHQRNDALANIKMKIWEMINHLYSHDKKLQLPENSSLILLDVSMELFTGDATGPVLDLKFVLTNRLFKTVKYAQNYTYVIKVCNDNRPGAPAFI